MNESLQMIEDCMARESKLTEWEQNFIESILVRIEDGKGLTPAQEDKLETIWDRVTS